MAQSNLPRATYADLEALPSNRIGEIIDGVLYASPLLGPRHARTAFILSGQLGAAFWKGRGGPGGWLLLNKPELHFGDDVLVPDITAWRRERMPEMPIVPFFTLAPDWVVEVLSPSTYELDRAAKLPVYAREGVGHVWLVDPIAQTLEVLRLARECYSLILTAAADQVVRAEPFDALELELSSLWAW